MEIDSRSMEIRPTKSTKSIPHPWKLEIHGNPFEMHEIHENPRHIQEINGNPSQIHGTRMSMEIYPQIHRNRKSMEIHPRSTNSSENSNAS